MGLKKIIILDWFESVKWKKTFGREQKERERKTDRR